MTDFTQRAWDDSGGGLLRQAPDKGIDPSHPSSLPSRPADKLGDLFRGFLIRVARSFSLSSLPSYYLAALPSLDPGWPLL